MRETANMSVVDFRYKVQDMATRITYMITKLTSVTSVTSLEGRSSIGNGIGGLASKATTNLVTCHATTLPDGDMPEKRVPVRNFIRRRTMDSL